MVGVVLVSDLMTDLIRDSLACVAVTLARNLNVPAAVGDHRTPRSAEPV